MWDDTPLASDFYVCFHSLSLFLSNWGKLNVSSAFHANFWSFLISRWHINPTATSSKEAVMFTASWVQRLELLVCDRSISVSVITNKFVGLKCLTQTKIQLFFITHVSILLRWDVKWFNFRPPTLLDQQCSSIWPQPKTLLLIKNVMDMVPILQSLSYKVYSIFLPYFYFLLFFWVYPPLYPQKLVAML